MRNITLLLIITACACEGGLALDPDAPGTGTRPGGNGGGNNNGNPTVTPPGENEPPEFQTALELQPFSRLTKPEYRLVVDDLLADLEVNDRGPLYGTISTFNENNYKGFYKNYDPISVSPGIESQQLNFATQLAGQYEQTRHFDELCVDGCADGVINRLLPRIWRRIPTDEEAQGLREFYAATPDEIKNRALLTRVFASPYFHYKIHDKSADETFQKMVLVSSLVAGSFPDDEIFADWEAGTLDDRWAFHIDRLLNENPQRFAELFVPQWLGLGSLYESDGQIDSTPLRTVMHEPAMIFTEILKDNDDISKMLDLDYNMVTPGLARVYGQDGAQFESGFQRAAITDTLFGTAALTYLTVDLESGNPNPIKRGGYVVNHLVCKYLLFPGSEVQSEVDRIVNEAPTDLSPPERMAYFREFDSCASCHNQFDFHGLALEEIGAFGTERDLYYTGDPITAEGEVDGILFSSSADFVEQLAVADTVRSCFASQVLSYATSTHHVPNFSKVQQIESEIKNRSAKEIVKLMLLKAIGESP